MAQKTFLIKTLGCKVNQYESQAMRERLVAGGFREATLGEEPNWCVVNTCTVTNESDRKSRNLIRKLHRIYPNACLLVTGCYVEREEDRLKVLSIPGVTSILTHSQRSCLPHVLRSGRDVSVSSVTHDEDFSYPISTFSGHHRAFLKIQDGCSHTCTYCKVRVVRPKFESRRAALVCEEAKALIQNGYREIVLTGIQLGAYGLESREGDALAKLVKSLIGLPGLERIRLSSIEPMDVSESLIELLSSETKVCPHLHIPLQSGDDSVLKAMRRPYSREQYKKLVHRLYDSVPSFALTTDVMVGFPGEGEKQFYNTLALLEELKPLKIHAFPYSDRKGTKAFNMYPKIPGKVIRKRVAELLGESVRWSVNFRDRSLGAIKKVLVEREIGSCLWEGHSEDYFLVRFHVAGSLLGRCVSVRIMANRDCFSEGQLVETLPQPIDAQLVAETGL